MPSSRSAPVITGAPRADGNVRVDEVHPLVKAPGVWRGRPVSSDLERWRVVGPERERVDEAYAAPVGDEHRGPQRSAGCPLHPGLGFAREEPPGRVADQLEPAVLPGEDQQLRHLASALAADRAVLIGQRLDEAPRAHRLRRDPILRQRPRDLGRGGSRGAAGDQGSGRGANATGRLGRRLGRGGAAREERTDAPPQRERMFESAHTEANAHRGRQLTTLKPS